MILDPELELHRLVANARVLPARFESALPESPIGADDFPGATAISRAHWAGAMFDAAVTLVDDVRTIFGSMFLLRGMLELWGGFMYVASAPDIDECRRRAVQIEIIAMQRRIGTLRVPGIVDDSEKGLGRGLAAAEARLATLQQRQKSHGGKPTPYGQVETWLKATGFEWPEPMYRGFSETIHNQAPEWASDPQLDVSWHHRAVRLEQCIIIYGNTSHLALTLIPGSVSEGFDVAVRSLLEDPYLHLALEGKFDEAM